MSSQRSELDDIMDEISESFKDKSEALLAQMSEWGHIIFELRNKKILPTTSPEEIAQLVISEELAWAAVYASSALYASQVEKQAWSTLEKLLRLLRNVLLMSV